MNSVSQSDLQNLTKDVTRMLGPRQLERLRSGYDPELLSDLATKTLVEKLPASRIWISTIQKILYKDEARGGRPLLDITGKERELCLITLLSAQHLELELGVHVYWGMMEGLEPTQVAALLTMVGVYAGLAKFNSALSVMTTTMHTLDKVARTGDTGVVTVLTALVAAFEPVAPGARHAAGTPRVLLAAQEAAADPTTSEPTGGGDGP